MSSFKMSVAAVLGALFFAAPAFAASPISNAFMANVKANVDFLAKSSQLSAERSTSSAARDFARDQAAEASRTELALNDATPTDGSAKLAAVDTGALMTGRSVSIDAPTGGQAKAANGRVPMGGRDIAAIAKLSGKSFDDTLWLKQVDALSQLRADYQAYVDDGDDPALAKMAERELPKVKARLEALSKI